MHKVHTSRKHGKGLETRHHSHCLLLTYFCFKLYVILAVIFFHVLILFIKIAYIRDMCLKNINVNLSRVHFHGTLLYVHIVLHCSGMRRMVTMLFSKYGVLVAWIVSTCTSHCDENLPWIQM